MIKFLHLLAILGLVGSAGYAYSIKYEATLYAEQAAKLRAGERTDAEPQEPLDALMMLAKLPRTAERRGGRR